jgi:pilus assembly protein Flp/PilA
MIDQFNHLVARVLTTRLRREDGQTLVEYALILALVSIVAIGALALLGEKINTVLTDVKNAL